MQYKDIKTNEVKELVGASKPLTFEELLAERDAHIENLQMENSMLQLGLMEMTMYTASQDERLQTQESALMELSMLVAGGGA